MNKENVNLNTLYNYDSEYSADSVEWCPHEPHQNVFVCANYHLADKEGSTNKERLGRILLFTTDPRSGLKLQQALNTPAVLDQKWCPVKLEGHPVLAVVNANKSIEIYKLRDHLQLEQVTSFTFDDDPSETLILSLDWSRTGDPEIVCSDSKGRVHLLRLNDNQLTIQHSHHAHGYEAWISAFCYHDLNIYFSGGDDCMFFKYDKRVSQGPVAKNRSHEAGVTSLHSHSSKEFLISTGSYDEYIRLWDHRTMKHELNSIKMPDTLWRIKWDPFEKSRLLAACMLGGVHVVDATNTQKLKIIASHYDHKNVAYGADWCHLDAKKCEKYPEEGNILIASCSFYDHLLCVSKFFNKSSSYMFFSFKQSSQTCKDEESISSYAFFLLCM